MKDSNGILALLSWVGYKLSSLLLHNNDKNGRKEECKKALERGKEEMKIIFILTVVSCPWGSCMFFSVLSMLTSEIYTQLYRHRKTAFGVWMMKKIEDNFFLSYEGREETQHRPISTDV